GCAPVLDFTLFPPGGRLLQQGASSVEGLMEVLGHSCRVLTQGDRHLPLLLRDLGEEHLLIRNTAEFPHQSGFVEQPNAPFGGIKLPRFDSIPVVMLKSVMEIVVTLPEGKPGHQGTVPGGALAGIRLPPQGMAKGIDEERHVVDENHPSYTGQEEASQRTGP